MSMATAYSAHANCAFSTVYKFSMYTHTNCTKIRHGGRFLGNFPFVHYSTDESLDILDDTLLH